MLVRFRVNNSSSYAYGMQGFSNALAAIATASANSNPSNPNTSQITDWEVIADSEAGGWSVYQNPWATSTPSSGYLRFYTPSAKGTATYKQKGIQFYNGSTSGDQNNQVAPAVYTANASGVPIDTVSISPYHATSATSSRYDTWYWPGDFSNMDYIAAITSEYFYVWVVDRGMDNSTGYMYRMCGVADHTYSSPVEADEASQHMPYYGVGIMGNYDANTTQDSSEFQIHVAFSQHVNPNGFFNSLMSGFRYYLTDHASTSSPNIINQNYITAIYPYFYSNNASGSYSSKQYMGSTFNTQGLESATINDIMITGPAKGTFTRVLKGIKWAGVNRNSSGLTIKAQDYQGQTLISDESTPQEYYAIASGGHVFCHPKK